MISSADNPFDSFHGLTLTFASTDHPDVNGCEILNETACLIMIGISSVPIMMRYPWFPFAAVKTEGRMMASDININRLIFFFRKAMQRK